MRPWILASACYLLLLTGCVRSSHEMLDERTAVISGRGSAFNTMGAVKRALLVDAAKIASERGFQYFAITDERARYVHSTLYSPGSASTVGTLNTTASGLPGTATYNSTYSGTTTYTPPSETDITKPRSEITVRFFRAGEVAPNVPGVWDAGSVLRAQTD